MKRHFFKNQEGQTAVEYLLIIIAAVSFGMTFMRQMEKYVVRNPNGFIAKPLKEFQSKLDSDSTGRYRYFKVY